jgi:hypothetical protein
LGRKQVLNSSDSQKSWQITLLSVTGQVGCLAILVIGLATVTGRWLDSQVSDGNSWFTIGLLLLSVPIVLYLTIRLALRSTRGLSSNTVSEIEEDEESNSDDRIT